MKPSRAAVSTRFAGAVVLVSLLWVRKGSAEPVSWASPDGVVTVKIAPPSGMVPMADDALPKMELDGVPDGKTVLRRGVQRAGTEQRLMALCVQTSSAMWAPDLEATIFDRLHDTVKQELERKGAVDRFSPGRPRAVPPRFEATLEAELAIMDRSKPRPLDASLVPKVQVKGRSLLGFVGKNADMLVCGLICAEPAEGAPACPALLAAATFDAAFVPPPSPSLSGRIVGSFARAPFASAGLLASLCLFGLGALLAAWPASRRGKSAEPAANDADEDEGDLAS